MAEEGWIEAAGRRDALVLRAGGDWLVARRGRARSPARRAAPAARRGGCGIDLGGVEALDTAGAWLVLRLERRSRRAAAQVTIDNLARVLGRCWPGREEPGRRSRRRARQRRAARRDRVRSATATHRGLQRTAAAHARLRRRSSPSPRCARCAIRAACGSCSLMAHMQRTGVAALPIVGLLSFLIGVVFAYQGAEQLRHFGAEIFTVNLLGIAFLRELGVLLAAIIVAGRSGSAFTAEIGTMQVNEEIDAMRRSASTRSRSWSCRGSSRWSLTLPLLTFYANVHGALRRRAAVLAGARHPAAGFPAAAPRRADRLGVLARHPEGAVLRRRRSRSSAAARACASRSAESVGRHTTRSVVAIHFPGDRHRCRLLRPLLPARHLSRSSGSRASRRASAPRAAAQYRPRVCGPARCWASSARRDRGNRCCSRRSSG